MNINNKNSDVSIWNVKIPKKIAENLNKISHERDIGSVEIIQKHENGPVEANIKFSDDLGLNVDLNVKLNNFNSNSYVIRDPDHNPKIEGKVVKEFVITPEVNEKYYKYLINRESKRKEREIETVVFEDVVLDDFNDHNEYDREQKKRKEILRNQRKERHTVDEAMNMLFNLFQKKEKWTAKELSEETGQPTSYILEILEIIGQIDSSEEYYSLKKEYKN